MSFISLPFLLFFCFCAIYFFLPHRKQNHFLLLASYFFYGWWDWRFLGLILFSSFVDFYCGSLLDVERHPEKSQKQRNLILMFSLVVNLGLLGFFKYFGFFISSLKVVLEQLSIPFQSTSLEIILPIGISFYTFQTLSYTIDVYRKSARSVDRLDDFFLYVSFFPQLVAGPIERATHLLPQIQKERTITRENISSGLQLMLVGFFKKMVIADNLALYVNSVFQSQAQPDGLSVWLGTTAFAFQIYADFSGYTDIARGTARVLGFDLCQNFRFPYFATNPSEFWQRWHISLSTWLRDYLYIPLGGNRDGRWRTFRNLMLTMFLGGLWHGASWNFAVWGIYHGFLLILFHAFSRKRSQEPRQTSTWVRFVQAFFFFQLILMGWLIFRVKSYSLFVSCLKSLVFGPWHSPLYPGLSSLLWVSMCCLPLLFFDLYRQRKGLMEPWRTWSPWSQALFHLILFYGIVFYGTPHATFFIYFQF
ncbi:MAG: MBOAT family protein [Deltaproteobacteria bacterium]|nr:MAG: MBOAT family protein [Deltaproteobacteria bacterium]